MNVQRLFYHRITLYTDIYYLTDKSRKNRVQTFLIYINTMNVKEENAKG